MYKKIERKFSLAKNYKNLDNSKNSREKTNLSTKGHRYEQEFIFFLKIFIHEEINIFFLNFADILASEAKNQFFNFEI